MLIGFLIVSILLIVNILTISKLKEDKSRLVDNERLLTQLLSQIQDHFSKIDTNIAEVATEEQAIQKMFSTHQKDENLILKTLEVNQNMFLDRMDKIVNIQQGLSDKISMLQTADGEGLITPEMVKMATAFMISQKRELSQLKTEVNSIMNFTTPLKQLVETLKMPQNSTDIDLLPLSNLLERIHYDIAEIKEKAANRRNDFQQSDKTINDAMANVETLTQHIDIAKRNIQNVIEQSIDLNPIYKSVHELIEQIKIIFDDYHLAKNEISGLVKILKDHEHEDLIDLKKEVNHFLHDIKNEIQTSVEMLKKEYHLGQNRVNDTVKTLSDRSLANSVYQQQIQENDN
jgi:chromosome segregation ATPase